MNFKLILSAAALAIFAVACGPDEMKPDGGIAAYAMVPGIYVASAASNITTDTCNQRPNEGASPLAGTEFNLTNVNGLVGLGNSVGQPEQPSQGSGQINNNSGTLIRDNNNTTGTCTYHRKVTNTVTVTANNSMTLNHTRVDSDVGATCTEITACTTQFTYSVTKKP